VITVVDLAKSFTGETGLARAIDGIDFEVPSGTFLTLLGPSGCGKTTTLRCLAGLERPDRGQIQIGGSVVVDMARRVFVPVHKRRIGMVFQSYAIWPHMTVMQNVCYPLEELRLNRNEVRTRGEAALELVGLRGYGSRLAPNLSGGQQQRVALARALVGEPEVLLLDEPLSNLDAKLRETMRGELRALQQRLGITTVYVTHDQVEALSMSDWVAVMSNGKIVEQGAPRELYERPKTRFVADFLGMTNFLPRCPHGCVSDNGASLRSVRPEDVQVSPSAGPEQSWVGEVSKALFLGSHTYCELQVNDILVKANVHHSVPIALAEMLYIWWEKEYCCAVAEESLPAGQSAAMAT
jgi:iron(III) transport system ATP-binding protein